MTKAKLKKILHELKQGLTKILGERLVGIYLFGSHARGEAWVGSDIDVLIVVEGVFDYFGLMDITSDLTWRLSLDNDIVISRVFMSAEKYRTGKTPFIQSVQREAIPL
jgi:predicted nucleotidyltransferase